MLLCQSTSEDLAPRAWGDLREGSGAASDMVAHSILDYCERAKDRFEKSDTLDLTRQFLVDYVQRII
jgi:hypothetical protein